MSRSPAFTVLIAEDEILLALEIEDLAGALGCRIIGPVARLEHLLTLIDEAKFDAALLDVSLAHDEKVYPAADRLRARGIPFAFMTAYGPASLDGDYAQDPILRKPYSAADVEQCVLTLIEKSSPQRATTEHHAA
jgi:CheY-like chemotaxis protein